MRSPIKDDEDVILFPSYGVWKKDHWDVQLRGWIFEHERRSIWRHALTRSIARFAKIDLTQDNPVFAERIHWFLVDNERRKRLSIRVGRNSFLSQASKPNGHFSASLILSKHPKSKVHATTVARDKRSFLGSIDLVPDEGVSVISDIDDTIKISDVRNRRELMANTFNRPFAPVEGVASLYRKWQSEGAFFHYVSGSPWQLYPALDAFLRTHDFPLGPFALRDFRLKDRSLANLLKPTAQHKIPTITRILKQFPLRQLILVGDTGESDPQIYGAIAESFPTQVKAIFLRRLPEDEFNLKAYQNKHPGVTVVDFDTFSQHTLKSLSLSHLLESSIKP